MSTDTLPRLPLDRAVDWFADGKPITYRDCILSQCGKLALTYAEEIQSAALRAQAEEVAALKGTLRHARHSIAQDRASLAECHTGPDGLDDEAAEAVADYDALLSAIDAHLATKQESPDA